MSAKTVLPYALILALVGVGTARSQPAQAPAAYTIPQGIRLPEAEPIPDDPHLPVHTWQVEGPSSWITYNRDCCQGPLGCCGPIAYEVYTRTGFSFPTNSGLLARSIETGWNIQGGARTLVFNPAGSSAWVFDLGIGYTYNNGNEPDTVFPLYAQLLEDGRPAFLPVSVRTLHRTTVNFSLGKEWYLAANGFDECNYNWRWGVDVGGRYGTSRADFNLPTGGVDIFNLENGQDQLVQLATAQATVEAQARAGLQPSPLVINTFERRSDEVTGFFVAVHTDLEVPLGGWAYLLVGARLEWDTLSTELIPLLFADSDLQNINLLMNLGLRF